MSSPRVHGPNWRTGTGNEENAPGAKTWRLCRVREVEAPTLGSGYTGGQKEEVSAWIHHVDPGSK